jgi:hypothetical protein
MTEFVCIVQQAGVATSGAPTPNPGVLFLLSDTGGSFQNEWFYAANSGKKEMLAVALAAISTQSQVNAWCDPPVTGGPSTECYNLYLTAS